MTASLLKSLLGILVDLNNAVVWMVSTSLVISKSSSLFTNPSVTVPRVPITIGIIVTFMFHSFFFNSLARSRYLSVFSLSFNLTLWSAGTAKSTILQVLFFLLIVTRSDRLADILLLLCSFESFSHQRLLVVSQWNLNDTKFPKISSGPVHRDCRIHRLLFCRELRTLP